MKINARLVLFFAISMWFLHALTGCTTTRTVYVPVSTNTVQSVVVQPPIVAPTSYGYGNGAVRVSSGRFLGIPFTSTSWSTTYTAPVYVEPPMEIYYSYPSYSAGFEWQGGRLERHRTWGPTPRHHGGRHR